MNGCNLKDRNAPAPIRFWKADPGQESSRRPAGVDIYPAVFRQERDSLFEWDRLLALEFLRIIQADRQLRPERQRMPSQESIRQRSGSPEVSADASAGRTSSSFNLSSVARSSDSSMTDAGPITLIESLL
jgi:hypothetical protein